MARPSCAIQGFTFSAPLHRPCLTCCGVKGIPHGSATKRHRVCANKASWCSNSASLCCACVSESCRRSPSATGQQRSGRLLRGLTSACCLSTVNSRAATCLMGLGRQSYAHPLRRLPSSPSSTRHQRSSFWCSCAGATRPTCCLVQALRCAGQLWCLQHRLISSFKTANVQCTPRRFRPACITAGNTVTHTAAQGGRLVQALYCTAQSLPYLYPHYNHSAR